MEPYRYRLADDDYPELLRDLPSPPTTLTTSGPMRARRAVAIVGSREACAESLALAYAYAFQLAKAGIVVVSGGAVGVDGAAHRGALAAGGATWVVSPTGRARIYPVEHVDLFAEVERAEESRMIWPFPDHHGVKPDSLRYRNGVLAALSDALIVVQAHHRSGSRNAASWARQLGRQLWAVPAAPWMGAFSGSLVELSQRDRPALPLCSALQLFRELSLGGRPATVPRPDPSTFAVARPSPDEDLDGGAPEEENDAPPIRPPARLREPDRSSWSKEENVVFSNLCTKPIHIDEITCRTGLRLPPVLTALLTLSLKDVVVEGPEGFFRRRNAA